MTNCKECKHDSVCSMKIQNQLNCVFFLKNKDEKQSFIDEFKRLFGV